MNIEQIFTEFAQKISITEKQLEAINKSIAYLKSNLEGLGYPSIKEIKIFGSYAKGTMIRPPYDIDLLALLDKNDYKGQGFTSWFTDSRPLPRSLLDTLRKKVLSIYPQSTVRRDKPCVTLDLSLYSFDIMPGFQTYNGYEIPNRSIDGWLSTNPFEFQNQLDQANILALHKLKPFIKMMKKWRDVNYIRLESYKIEMLANQVFLEGNHNYSYPLLILNFLKKLKSNNDWAITLGLTGAITGLIGAFIGGATGYILDRYLDHEDVDAINESYDLSEQACNLLRNGDIQNACVIYRTIFGSDFPLNNF